MKFMMHMRVFELVGSHYQMIDDRLRLEAYVMAELHSGYVVTDMTSFGVERLRVTTYYSPDTAKKQLSGTTKQTSKLSEKPWEEV